MAEAIARRLFTIHEYHRMIATGILRESDRVELLGGEIRHMPPIRPAHAAVESRSNPHERA